MVRRFVEQQQVGLGEQQGSKSDAHFPAARIAVEGPRLHLLVKAQAKQDSRRSRRSAVGVDRQQPLMDLAQPVWIGAGFTFLDQPRALGVGSENGFEGTGDAGRRFLRDIAKRVRAGQRRSSLHRDRSGR